LPEFQVAAETVCIGGKMANGWSWYGTASLQVVPYAPFAPVYLDNTLPHLYARTKEEGNLSQVFMDDEFNLGKFVVFFEKRAMQCLCRVVEDKRLIPLGYTWVESPFGVDGCRGALIGFCFFRDAVKESRDLGRLGLAYHFIDLQIDILHGAILEDNTPALNYAKRLGFKPVAFVPKWRYVGGKMVGVHVVQLEKNDFLSGFTDWIESKKVVAEHV
jgi:hypothetical protein